MSPQQADQASWLTSLAVEDELGIAGLLAGLFEDEGHRIRTAPNGRAAMVSIAARLPNLVLTDTTMPVTTGPELVTALLDDACFAATPVIVMERPARGEGALQPSTLRHLRPEAVRMHELAGTVTRVLAGVVRS